MILSSACQLWQPNRQLSAAHSAAATPRPGTRSRDPQLQSYRRPADRRSRPQRWRDAIPELLALQAEYAAWSDTPPDGLSQTPTAEALNAMAELNLSDLAAIEPPRGYGRD